MVNAESRIATLDAKVSAPFAIQCGPSIEVDLLEWVRLIVSRGPTLQNFDRLNTLAWYIFVERQGAAFGEPSRFTVASRVSDFQEFVYAFNVFTSMEIPYNEWESVVERLFATLKTMADSNSLDFQSAE